MTNARAGGKRGVGGRERGGIAAENREEARGGRRRDPVGSARLYTGPSSPARRRGQSNRKRAPPALFLRGDAGECFEEVVVGVDQRHVDLAFFRDVADAVHQQKVAVLAEAGAERGG